MKNIKHNIYVGDKQDAKDSENLSEENIDTVISLIDENIVDRNHLNRRCYRSYALLDNGANPQEQVDAAIYAVAGEIESEGNFLVHCAAGMSRSPTILAGALTLVENSDLEEQVNYLKDRYEPFSLKEDLYEQVKESVERFRDGVDNQ